MKDHKISIIAGIVVMCLILYVSFRRHDIKQNLSTIDLKQDSVISVYNSSHTKLLFQIKEYKDSVYVYKDSLKNSLVIINSKDSVLKNVVKKDIGLQYKINRCEKDNDSLRAVLNSFIRVGRVPV